MHYTSGTTGKPKGAAHVHNAIIGQYATGKYVLDFHDDDIYWCTADPGWVTGTSYGMFAPWCNGVTSLVYEGGFGAGHWYSLIEKYKVTVWYTRAHRHPHADEGRRRGPEEARPLVSLRYTMSVGEPLNPEAVVWSEKVLGLPFHDNWWQTETGAIMIANYPIMEIRPGSMGRPFPGIDPAIIDDDGNEVAPGEEGNLAVQARLAFDVPHLLAPRGAVRLPLPERLVHHRRPRPHGRRRLLLVRRPRGRRDQHRRPPRRPVRGGERADRAPRRRRGRRHRQARPRGDGDREGVRRAQGRLRAEREAPPRAAPASPASKLGAGVAPREIEFMPTLPKTRSGKIMRRLLKARELGLPEGDTSTLEED